MSFTIEQLEESVLSGISKYNIPEHRKTTKTIHNYRWLRDNLAKRNADKPHIKEILSMLEVLSKEKK